MVSEFMVEVIKLLDGQTAKNNIPPPNLKSRGHKDMQITNCLSLIPYLITVYSVSREHRDTAESFV